MPYAKLDDNFPDHPKVIELSDSAFRLHVTAICYCSRFLTDGTLSGQAIKRMAARPRDIASLVNAGLWEVGDGKTYRLHDYLDYNASRELVEATRAERAAAGALGGRKSGEARRSKREANASAIASDENEANGKQYPLHSNRETKVSLENEPSFVRELRAEWMLMLPAKYQRDATTFDDMGLLAHDYSLDPEPVRDAIRAIKRDGDIPFPGSIRKRLKEAAPPRSKELPFQVVGGDS